MLLYNDYTQKRARISETIVKQLQCTWSRNMQRKIYQQCLKYQLTKEETKRKTGQKGKTRRVKKKRNKNNIMLRSIKFYLKMSLKHL